MEEKDFIELSEELEDISVFEEFLENLLNIATWDEEKGKLEKISAILSD